MADRDGRLCGGVDVEHGRILAALAEMRRRWPDGWFENECIAGVRVGRGLGWSDDC
jgi:hypothetical protein